MSEDKTLPMEYVENTQVTIKQKSPIEMASALIEQKVDPSFVEKMLDLQIKFEKNEAKKAYFEAVTEFKKNPPKIYKDKKVSYDTSSGTTEYNHASLGNVTEVISSELSRHV